jgi:intein/homing endonuclease
MNRLISLSRTAFKKHSLFRIEPMLKRSFSFSTFSAEPEIKQKEYKLSDSFIKKYASLKPKNGFDFEAITVVARSFSRRIEGVHGGPQRKESWRDVVQRVVESTFGLIHFMDEKEKKEMAERMFDMMYHCEFLPAGRGLFSMGTPIMKKGLFEAMNNCGFISTEGVDQKPTRAFEMIMELLMLGVGVGSDVRGAGKCRVVHPKIHPFSQMRMDNYLRKKNVSIREFFMYDDLLAAKEFRFIKDSEGEKRQRAWVMQELETRFQIFDGAWIQTKEGMEKEHPTNLETYAKHWLPEDIQCPPGGIHSVGDSREGWIEAVTVRLLGRFLKTEEEYQKGDKEETDVLFSFHQVRPKGVPLKTFGGVSGGPSCLVELLRWIRWLCYGVEHGSLITGRMIADITNMLGRCVSAGNVRRSAEILIGDMADEEFVNLKNYELNPERANFGWASNNSVLWNEKGDLDSIVDGIYNNGEPGILFFENMRKYGRMGDEPNYKDAEAKGVNPCVTSDTCIMTSEGHKFVHQLIGKPFTAMVDGKPYKSSQEGFFCSGRKRILHLYTKEGYNIRLTKNHKIMTQSGEWVEAQYLKAGNCVKIHNHYGANWDRTSGLIRVAECVHNYLEGGVIPNLDEFGFYDQIQFLKVLIRENHVEEEGYWFKVRSLEDAFVIQRMFLRLGVTCKLEDEYRNSKGSVLIGFEYGDYDYFMKGLAMQTGYPPWEAVPVEKEQFFATIDCMQEEEGEEDVYDCTIEEVHAFDGNGFYLHNCVPKDTWVYTKEGARQVSDLIGKPFEALVNGKCYPSSSEGFFPTGNQKVLCVTTSEGYSVRLTDNHKVLTQNKKWVDAKELKVGDKVILQNHLVSHILDPSGEGSYEDGKNGCFAYILCKDYCADVHECKSMDYCRGFLYHFILTKMVTNQPSYVIRSHTNDILNAVNLRDIEEASFIQRMLLRIGIYSTIEPPTKDTDERLLSMNPSAFYMFGAACSPTSVQQPPKSFSLDGYIKGFIATISSVTEGGNEDVYDCTIEGVHAFDGNGFYLHNCGEQTLMDKELCNLVEIFLPHVESLDRFKEIIENAFLYGKIVSTLPSRWQEINEVIKKNRRIGLSVTGVVQFISKHGRDTLIEWLDKGYLHAKKMDEIYSSRMGVSTSIKITTVKPSGTLSLVAGVTPACNYPYAGQYYVRRINIDNSDPILGMLSKMGYHMEPSVYTRNTTVVSFPKKYKEKMKKGSEVPVREQLEVVALVQKHWADNNVSATVVFDKSTTTKEELKELILEFKDKIKCVSFLPSENNYAQLPYEEITEEKYHQMISNLSQDLNPDTLIPHLFPKEDAEAPKYCDSISCTIQK